MREGDGLWGPQWTDVCISLCDRLGSLVVRRKLESGRQVDYRPIHTQTLTTDILEAVCQTPSVVGPMLGLGGPVSVCCDEVM